MKKILAVSAALLLAAIIVCVAVPSLREEAAWSWARFRDSPASYQRYLASWPDGGHLPRARLALDDAQWRVAEELGTLESFRAYLRENPEGRHTGDARDRLDDRAWERASETRTVAALESYIGGFPDGWYVEEAHALLEQVHWEAAVDAGTIADLKAYVEAFPSGPHCAEADQRIKELAADDAPFRAAIEQGSRESLESFMADYPGHARQRDARTILDDMSGRHLLDLAREGRVEASPRGSGITSVRVQLENLMEHPVTVLIPVGTFFVSRNASAQNMVTTEEREVTLPPGADRSLAVPAACANRPRDIPDSGDDFQILRSPQQAELERLMPRLRESGADSDVVQAAVWMVTDDASYGDLGILVRRSIGQIFGGERVIKEAHAAEAMRILEQAGIDITAKAIWRDRQRILEGLEDGELKAWLRGRAGGPTP